MKKILILLVIIVFGGILKAQDASEFKKGIIVGKAGNRVEIDSITLVNGFITFYTLAGDTLAPYTPTADKVELDIALFDINTPDTTGTVVAETGITVDDLDYVIYFNTTSIIDISADPQIVDGIDGQRITIIGSSDTNTLKLDDGTGLQLAGGASFTLGVGDVIVLIYIETLDLWLEVSRSNN